MRKFQEEPVNSYIYLKIFLLVVLFCILFSLVYRGAKLVSESKFWGSYFNLLVKMSENYYLLQINNSSSRATLLEISDVSNVNRENLRFEVCMEVGVPCDGLLVHKNISGSQKFEDTFSFLNVINMITSQKDIRFENMNALDIVKIYFYLKSVSDNNFNKLNYDQEKVENSKIYDLFKNDLIINDKLSLEIINNSGIDGLGSKFAIMLKNVGYNVVSVSSSDEKSVSKIIYRLDSNSVTLRYLKELLNVPTEYKNEASIADITVVLGNDLFPKE